MRQKIVFLLVVIVVLTLFSVGLFILITFPQPPFKGGVRLSPLEGSTRRGRDVVTVKIGDGVFNLRVADDIDERTRGLGGVQTLAPNAGMLFIFPQDDFYAIWMKDMLIPIDILWLSESREVIDLRTYVSPNSFPAIFTPKTPARFVVELSSGSTKMFGIKIGSRAQIFSE